MVDLPPFAINIPAWIKSSEVVPEKFEPVITLSCIVGFGWLATVELKLEVLLPNTAIPALR